MSSQDFMIWVKVLVDQHYIYDFILHQIGVRTVVIEFGFTKDIIVLAFMPCDFCKSKKLFLCHQRFILRSDDPIELTQGDNAIQVRSSIKILPQKPRSGVLQWNLPIERIKPSASVFLRHWDIIRFLSAHSASSTMPKSIKIFLSP